MTPSAEQCSADSLWSDGGGLPGLSPCSHWRADGKCYPPLRLLRLDRLGHPRRPPRLGPVQLNGLPAHQERQHPHPAYRLPSGLALDERRRRHLHFGRTRLHASPPHHQPRRLQRDDRRPCQEAHHDRAPDGGIHLHHVTCWRVALDSLFAQHRLPHYFDRPGVLATSSGPARHLPVHDAFYSQVDCVYTLELARERLSQPDAPSRRFRPQRWRRSRRRRQALDLPSRRQAQSPAHSADNLADRHSGRRPGPARSQGPADATDLVRRARRV
ncbi:RHTO0S02e05138g1_1 [Rhodotorula toruloides]|uniref:RHTO0S02e05138g1_1 n=1 Tax=Rhodotorula toruloides TaxID=5286 RepID=A0A061AGF6_RHOTO|nr:RHTO0S02e05138g1_1 [Rhodotorula toruloides]